MTKDEVTKLSEIRDGMKGAFWDFEKARWMDKLDQFIRDAEHILAGGEPTPRHDWTASTLGHGESMCRKCGITNREAAVLGELNVCRP